MYLYLALSLTDYLETQITSSVEQLSEMRLQLAWAMTILLVATISINFVYALVNISCSAIQRLRQRNVSVMEAKPEASSKVILIYF
jgi:hypothetical protein